MSQPKPNVVSAMRGTHCMSCWWSSGKLVGLQEYNGHMACEECGQIDDVATLATNDQNEEVYSSGRAFQTASTLGRDMAGRGTAETWNTGTKAELRNKSILDGWLRAYCGGTNGTQNTSIFLKPMPHLLAASRQTLVQILVQDAHRRGPKAHTVYDVDRLRLRFYAIVAVRLAAEKQALGYIDDVLKGRAGDSLQLDNDIPGILPWDTVLVQINSEEGVTNVQRDLGYLRLIHRKVLGLLDMRLDDATQMRLYILTLLLRIQQILTETSNGSYDTMRSTPPTRSRRWKRADFRYFRHFNVDFQSVLGASISLYDLQASIGVWQMYCHRKPTACATACVLCGLVAPTGHPLTNVSTWTTELSATFGESHFVALERHSELSKIILIWSLSLPDIGVAHPQLPPTNRPMGDGFTGWSGNPQRGIPRESLYTACVHAVIANWTTLRDERLDGACLRLLGGADNSPTEKIEAGHRIAAQRAAQAGFGEDPTRRSSPFKRLTKLRHQLSPERTTAGSAGALESEPSERSRNRNAPEASTVQGLLGLGLDVIAFQDSNAGTSAVAADRAESPEGVDADFLDQFESYDADLRSPSVLGTSIVDEEELEQDSQAYPDFSAPGSPLTLPPLFHERSLYVLERDARLPTYADRVAARAAENKSYRMKPTVPRDRRGKTLRAPGRGDTLLGHKEHEGEEEIEEVEEREDDGYWLKLHASKDDDPGTPVWYADELDDQDYETPDHLVHDGNHDGHRSALEVLELDDDESDSLLLVVEEDEGVGSFSADMTKDEAEVDWDAIQAEVDARALPARDDTLAKASDTQPSGNPPAGSQERVKPSRRQAARTRGLPSIVPDTGDAIERVITPKRERTPVPWRPQAVHHPGKSTSEDSINRSSVTGTTVPGVSPTHSIASDISIPCQTMMRARDALQVVDSDIPSLDSKRGKFDGADSATTLAEIMTQDPTHGPPAVSTRGSTKRTRTTTADAQKSQPRPRKVYKNLDLYKRVTEPAGLGSTSNPATTAPPTIGTASLPK